MTPAKMQEYLAKHGIEIARALRMIKLPVNEFKET